MALRVLLTNDDGIDAPGLLALERAASVFAEVVIIAPMHEQSGCGHQVTTHAAIAVEGRGGARWAVDGTPADCVRLGLPGLAGRVDWVLSGINAGGNLGTDIYHSGTVAAAREAALHGVPGMAISHLRRRGVAISWDDAALRAQAALAELLGTRPPRSCYWNLNLAHLDPGTPIAPLERCPLDPSPLPLAYAQDPEDGSFRYAGDYHRRSREPGSDVERCMAGATTLTELRL